MKQETNLFSHLAARRECHLFLQPWFGNSCILFLTYHLAWRPTTVTQLVRNLKWAWLMQENEHVEFPAVGLARNFALDM